MNIFGIFAGKVGVKLMSVRKLHVLIVLVCQVSWVKPTASGIGLLCCGFCKEYMNLRTLQSLYKAFSVCLSLMIHLKLQGEVSTLTEVPFGHLRKLCMSTPSSFV